MKTKSRKKVSRARGTHTHSRGFKKKARGSGHQGGVGNAGTGKRADQKKTKILLYGQKYFGTSKTWRKPIPQRDEIMNLDFISINLFNLIKKGIAKEKSKDTYELDLKKYKILSGEVKKKFIIHAKSASTSAIDKVKKAGGDIIIE